ncbi:MAG TPA: electron transfer flavoprotein subunit alpha [Verrucomicrobiales bacterium]|nr:electron transfer flavoprotein subunit alpha [Verrucomicrobiales bacterium]
MKRTLVIAELDHGVLKPCTHAAVAAARRAAELAGGTFEILLLGPGAGTASGALLNFGAAALHVAEHPELAEPLADRYAVAVAHVARGRGTDFLIAAASTFSKDLLPRVAGLLDAGMLSDVVEIGADSSGPLFKRVLHAGNAIATVILEGPVRVATLRAAAFPPAPRLESTAPVLAVDLSGLAWPDGTSFVARDRKTSARPDATEARIVVSGGRGIKTSEDFERLVGGLADALGGAVGSSRALVDAGITANSLQIGQTGKVVAPDLYIAVGISGAIQHIAGMKDTKVIVAINKDPDAPIFEVADLGLVADVYQAVPEMIERLQRR